ncbi:MAG TPA: 23S rRNA (uracil(1939)-C(5))-methyltransferase RlmD [Clostridiales bacterium]|nr:23S rRNA (uracil(1939)-C(5))-methyltransferase RlmD [Clostridiales bacterium]
MNKNENVKIKINNYGCNAEGVAKFNGETIFVPYSLVGEEIEATIIKANSKYSIGKITKICEQSNERIVAPCPYFTKCGGCQLQHTKYENGLKIKTEIVQNAIQNIGKINYIVPQLIASDNKYQYRNKIAMPINPHTRRVGMYRLNSHKIVDIENCLLQKTNIKILIETINQYLSQSKNSIYDEETRIGLLKSIVARDINNTVLLTVVINGESLNDAELLIKLLSQKFNKLGINININKLNNNVIMTNNFKHIYGLNEIDMFDFGIRYTINNASFLQVNDEIKKLMYQKIFDETKNDIVINAYSGAGLLSAMLAKNAKKVYGIEIVEAATKLADDLKKQNNIHNLTNITGDCSEKLPELLNTLNGNEKQNLTIVLDPPRKGCDKKVLNSILNCSPAKIIYMSCDPSTLARDLNILMQSDNYKVKYIQPYDMFPQTKHVETLAVLETKK